MPFVVWPPGHARRFVDGRWSLHRPALRLPRGPHELDLQGRDPIAAERLLQGGEERPLLELGVLGELPLQGLGGHGARSALRHAERAREAPEGDVVGEREHHGRVRLRQPPRQLWDEHVLLGPEARQDLRVPQREEPFRAPSALRRAPRELREPACVLGREAPEPGAEDHGAPPP